MPNLFGRRNFRVWLAIVGCSTLTLGAAYTMVQQSARLSANDLPLAAAQTAKHQLSDGSAADDVVPTTKTQLSTDSTTFVIVTDEQAHVLASSAALNDQSPLPPRGVFNSAQANGIDKVTWQPADRVRAAIVVMPYSNSQGKGYIVAGQPLSEVEDHIDVFSELTLISWIAIVALASLLLLTPEPWNIDRLGGAKQVKKAKV